MKLQNNFSEENRALFIWNYNCFWCGRSGCDALHHILGRISDSPLNACPIHNQICHIGNGDLSTFEVKKNLLQKTLKYLLKNEYILTAKDKKFKEENRKYYKNMNEI